MARIQEFQWQCPDEEARFIYCEPTRISFERQGIPTSTEDHEPLECVKVIIVAKILAYHGQSDGPPVKYSIHEVQ